MEKTSAEGESGKSRIIPVDSIIAVDGAYPRSEITEERVAVFKEIYQDDEHDLPPIEVFLVQTGDPKNPNYALLDGMHRLLALKQLKVKKTGAIVYSDVCITAGDLESGTVKSMILYKAAKKDWRSPLAYRYDERKNIVRRLYEYGTDIKDLHIFATTSTLYEWLSDKKEKEQKVKEEAKKEALRLRAQGVLQKRVADLINDKYGIRISRRTISDWEKEAEKAAGDDVAAAKIPKSEKSPRSGPSFKSLDLNDKIEAGGNGAEGQGEAVGGKQASSASEEAKEKESLAILDDIYEKLRLLHITPKVEHDLEFYLLPLLCEISNAVNSLLKDGGYAAKYEAVKSELINAQKDLAEKTGTISEKNTLISELQEELAKRKEQCASHCSFTKEGVAREFEKYVGSLLDDVERHAEALPELSRDAKGRRALERLALNSAYKFLSSIDWGLQHNVLTRKVRGAFDRFEKFLPREFSTEVSPRVLKLKHSICESASCRSP